MSLLEVAFALLVLFVAEVVPFLAALERLEVVALEDVVVAVVEVDVVVGFFG